MSGTGLTLAALAQAAAEYGGLTVRAILGALRDGANEVVRYGSDHLVELGVGAVLAWLGWWFFFRK